MGNIWYNTERPIYIIICLHLTETPEAIRKYLSSLSLQHDQSGTHKNSITSTTSAYCTFESNWWWFYCFWPHRLQYIRAAAGWPWGTSWRSLRHDRIARRWRTVRYTADSWLGSVQQGWFYPALPEHSAYLSAIAAIPGQSTGITSVHCRCNHMTGVMRSFTVSSNVRVQQLATIKYHVLWSC